MAGRYWNPAGYPVRCGRRPAPVPKRFSWGVLWGSCASDHGGLLVHGSVFRLRPGENSCQHFAAGGSTFFSRKGIAPLLALGGNLSESIPKAFLACFLPSGKDSQQEETPETKSCIHGICKFWTRPQEVSEYCSIPKPGRNPSSGGVFHGSDTLAPAGCKIVFPRRRL